jgi:hypothetical protein
MAMIRKQIYLDAEMDRALKREARKRGVSESEIIRERIANDCVHVHAKERDEESLAEFLKLLRRAGREAAKYPGAGRKFNREEAYEERLERQMPRRY